jgi:hypothetical protein
VKREHPIDSSAPNETARSDNWLRSWPFHFFVAVLYASLIAAKFAPWLRPFQQPQRGGPEYSFRAGDLTPLFSVWTQVASRSLFVEHTLPFWSDHIYCGEPFFSKPQIGVFSLTTALCAVLPPQVAATWTFLLHLWIGGLAMYAFCSVTLRHDGSASVASHEVSRAVAAACGGAVFLFSAFTIEQTMIGHGPIVNVACWMPLVLAFLHRLLTTQHPVRNATCAGVFLAVQLLAGGESMFLYNAMAGGVVALVFLLSGAGTTASGVNDVTPGGGWPDRWSRMFVAGAVTGVVGFGLSAVKVLPGMALMPISNRAGGLSLEDSGAFIWEFTEPALLRGLAGEPGAFSDWRHLFPIALAMSLVGTFAGLRRRPLRPHTIVALLLVVVGVSIAHWEGVFALLWKMLPMFRYQRIPQRALVLTYLGLSVLVALGVYAILIARIRRSANGLCGAILLAGIVCESWFGLPPLPPTADIRREVQENQILNHVSQQPGLFRIHAVESNDRNWGIEHVTVPLGLSNLAGWDHLWLLEYLGAEGLAGRDVRPFLRASYEAQHPARFWGMMNVRFVTSTREIQVPGLEFRAKFDVSPRCQPKKSAGPYLYENTECMPRAWTVPQAILVLGDAADRLDAAYHLMDHPSFDPRRVVVIQSDVSGSVRPADVASFDAIAIPARWSPGPGQSPALHPRTIRYSVTGAGQGRQFHWTDSVEIESMFTQLAEAIEPSAGDGQPSTGPAITQVGISHGGHARLEVQGAKGYLVLAEKIAHFPGWTATSEAGSRPLLRANGVASAMRLDGSENWIDLRYRPPGLALGVWITLIALVTVPFLGWLGDRVVRL